MDLRSFARSEGPGNCGPVRRNRRRTRCPGLAKCLNQRPNRCVFGCGSSGLSMPPDGSSNGQYSDGGSENKGERTRTNINKSHAKSLAWRTHLRPMMLLTATSAVQSNRAARKNRARKLTYGAQIAIVRRFREYPGRVVGEIRHTTGWRKARANLVP